MAGGLTVRFWGVRGSHPSPGPRTARLGGNTPCVEIEANDDIIIIDAGTGIIELGNDLLRRFTARGRAIRATLLFSHTHQDHIQGFPFFKPAFIGSTICNMFGPQSVTGAIGHVLSQSMLPPLFPIEMAEMKALKTTHTLLESEVVLIGGDSEEPRLRNVHRQPKVEEPDLIAISAFKSYAHPQGGSYIYKIRYRDKVVVYASDTECYHGGDVKLINFARDADLLIHDAQYTDAEYRNERTPRQGWGHSTVGMAAETAAAAGAKRLALFHHDPSHDDDQIMEMAESAKSIFKESFAAHEGLTIEL